MIRDAILAQQRSDLRFGGSYDWYRLFDRSGAKEIAPVDAFEMVEAIKADIDASGPCGP